MKLLLAALLLLPILASGATAGQSIIQKKNVGAGFTAEEFTISNGQLVGRTSAGTLSGITLGTGLSLTGTTINASASGGAQDNYLLDTFTAETLTTGQNGMGWDENGYFTIGSSAGWLQIYEAGDPVEQTIHFAGRITADALEAASITGDITGQQVASGQIPGGVMAGSMPRPMLHWQNSATYAGANGLTYAATGPGGQIEPQKPAMYFAGIEVIDGDPNANYLQGRIRSASQVRSDLGLVIGTNVLAYTAPGTSGNVLTSNGSAWVSSAAAGGGITIGTTTSNGTAGRVLYTDGTNVQAYTITGTGNVMMSASPTSTGTATFGTVATNTITGVTQPTTTMSVGGNSNYPYATEFGSFAGHVLTIGKNAGASSSSGILMRSDYGVYFSSGTNPAISAVDVAFERSAAGVLKIVAGPGGALRDVSVRIAQLTDYIEGTEMTAPAAPAANKGRIFFEDNGAGKTRLMVIFPSGAAQQIAIEP